MNTSNLQELQRAKTRLKEMREEYPKLSPAKQKCYAVTGKLLAEKVKELEKGIDSASII